MHTTAQRPTFPTPTLYADADAGAESRHQGRRDGEWANCSLLQTGWPRPRGSGEPHGGGVARGGRARAEVGRAGPVVHAYAKAHGGSSIGAASASRGTRTGTEHGSLPVPYPADRRLPSSSESAGVTPPSPLHQTIEAFTEPIGRTGRRSRAARLPAGCLQRLGGSNSNRGVDWSGASGRDGAFRAWLVI